MSPRFSGKQYPGAMRDYRARKREEATARQSAPPPLGGGSDALGALGSILVAPFVALAEIVDGLVGALAGQRGQTRDGFALVPAPICGGAEPAAALYDNGGALPSGLSVVRNESGEPWYFDPARPKNETRQ